MDVNPIVTRQNAIIGGGENHMTQMTQEQEIRCKALEMKINADASVMSAAIIAGKKYSGTVWNDGDLEIFVAYIKDGIKPKEE